jgi:hypothetical protein
MNTGADGRPDVGGASAKPPLHLTHTFLHDPFHGPTPAGMKDSYRSAFCVHQNNWQAIGGQNCEEEARGSGDQAVAGKPRLGDLRNAMNKVRVNLAERNQRPLSALTDGSYLLEERGPILFHRALRILPGETEIQASPAITLGESTRSSAETMNEPRHRRKRVGLENLALACPEGFQRHRNILATYPRSCNAAYAANSKRYVNDGLPSPHHRPPTAYNSALR